MAAKRIRVTGRVQGVFFRAHTQEKATELGLMGWVRNTGDDAVEIHAEGPKEAIDALEQWCEHGPNTAEVTRVESRDAPAEGAASFEIRYD